MIHEDGIEVYLKPGSEAKDDLRFPELELEESDGLRKRCCVPAIEEQFRVVIKYSHTFNMSSGDCLYEGIAADMRRGGVKKGSTLLPKCSVLGQTMKHGSIRGTTPKLRMRSLSGKISQSSRPTFEELCCSGKRSYRPGNGVIVIFVARGTAERLERCDPTRSYSIAETTFKRVEGEGGLPYIFEFHPRSKTAITIDEKLLLGSHNKQTNVESNASKFVFIPDPGFNASEAETERIREDIRAAWRSKSRSKAQTSTKTLTVSGQGSPPTCKCPPETHARPRSKTTSKSKTSLPNNGETCSKTQSAGNADEDEDSDQGSEAVSKAIPNRGSANGNQDTAEETTARTCGQCQKYKKPPRGKKLAYRQRAGKWMYVHKDAPDGVAPAEDRHDEEPLPTGPDVPDTVSPESEVSEGMQREVTDPGEQNAGGRAPTAGQDDRDEAVKSAETKSATAAHEVLLVSEATSLPKTPTQHAAPAIDTAAGGIETIGLQMTPSTPESSDPKKRQNESECGGLVQKQVRIDIDLTCDDDNDVVFVKSEVPSSLRSQLGMESDDEEAQFELGRIQREKRKLGLEDKEAEVKHRQARRRRLHRQQAEGQKPIKKEAVVKIEE